MFNMLKSLPEKRGFRMAVALSPILITLIWMIWPGFIYMKNDDIMIMQIAKETGYVADFISVICTTVLNHLYTSVGGIEWFSVWLLASFSISFIVLHASVLRLRSWLPHLVIWGFQIFCYSSVTYTTTAYVSIIAGMLLYIMKVDFSSLRKSILPMLISAILIFNGSILRTSDPFLSCAAMIVPLALLKLVRREQKLSALIVLLVICLASQAAVFRAQDAAISSDPAIADFHVFSQWRGPFMDNGGRDAPDEYIEESGLYLSDHRLATRYSFADASVFTEDWFESASGYTRELSKDISRTIIRIIKTAVNYVITLETGFVLAGLVCLLCLFAAFFRRKALLYVLMSIALLALQFLYLLYIHRAISRVTNVLDIISLLVMCVILLSVPAEPFESRPKLLKVSRPATRLFSFLLIFFLLYYTGFRLSDSKRDASAFEAHQQFIKADDSGRRYVYEAVTANVITDYRISLVRHDESTPLRLLGDWYARSPFWIEKMKQAGFEEHLGAAMDILLEDKVRLVVLNPSEELPGYYTDFFKNHRGLDVNWTIESVPGSTSFKFFDFDIVSAEESINS